MTTATHPRRRHTESPRAAAADTTSPPDISNLQACVQDAQAAGLDSDPGPEDPVQFSPLRQRLDAVRATFPPLYAQTVVNPFIQTLDELGQDGFTQVLLRDPRRQGEARLMLDIAQAILQTGERFQEKATDAFLQVVGDLYDGFLSAEDRKGVQPPENATTPPLVKWGEPDAGPYTWPIDATKSFNLQAAIVNLPPANARQGLLGWAALGHETCGHDILRAYAGLEDQLATAVNGALNDAGMTSLADYWSNRIDETASDVMGILNMGPAAAIGIIGYLRGLNAAFTGNAKLRNEGPAADPHPADIIRGYLGAAVVSRLSFSQASAWQDLLIQETDKDLDDIVLEGASVDPDQAKQSAVIVATAIVGQKVPTLEDHSIGDIQDWTDKDESLVNLVRPLLRTVGDFPFDNSPRIYAAHVTAAAVMEALSENADLPTIIARMTAILDAMHAHDPSWGPLMVRHPGDLARDLAYRRHRRFGG